MQQMNDNQMPFVSHLDELRKRLLISFTAFLLMTCLAYAYVENIYHYLTLPLANASDLREHRLIFTGLTEAFFTYIKLSCFMGFIAAFPIIASQLYFFVAPGLYKKEKSSLIPYLIMAPILFLTGAVLVYFYVMPLAWKFFISFESLQTDSLVPMVLEARVSEYLSLVISLIIGFGVAFQLPIILILLCQIGVVSGTWLAQKLCLLQQQF
jgi:sec-independent protein translocase protein TatC